MRLLTCWIVCGCAFAQPSGFDVASFRRMQGDPLRGTERQVTATSLVLRQATLGNLLSFAYGREHYEVIGPDWRDRPTTVLYTVEAKTPRAVEPAEMKRMLQRLIEERLGLVWHRETRELPVFVLTVDRGGPKFRASVSEGDRSIHQPKPYVTTFQRISMADFAKTLDPPFTSRHVLNETGLPDVYDFTVDLAPYVLDSDGKAILDARGAIDNEGANLLALPKQLGLRLDRKTRPTDVMVIDGVAKDPADN